MNSSPRLTLPRSARIAHKRDYKRVFDARCSQADGLLVLYAAVNETGRPRLGLSVSTKLGRATVRNRYKRLLREAFRLTQHDLPPGLDYVLIPRAGRPGPATLVEYRRSLTILANKAARRLASGS